MNNPDSQSIQNMIKDGANNFVEVGPGKTLQGLIKKIDWYDAKNIGCSTIIYLDYTRYSLSWGKMKHLKFVAFHA